MIENRTGVKRRMSASATTAPSTVSVAWPPPNGSSQR